MNRLPPPTGLPRHRFPVEPWRLVETEYSHDDLGHTETLFAVGNGFLGMRGNPEEGREAHSHGTYLNGFHETWPIHHAEEAFGFAKTGQTIVNAPDAKLIKLYVDDDPFILAGADLDAYERALDFRQGMLVRDVVWRSPGGKRVHIRSQRMVSLVHRHLAVMTMEITLLDASAPVVISSQLLNRQDGEDEYHVEAAALGEGRDPRRARKFTERVLEPRGHYEHDNEVILGYRCRKSRMTLACGYRHVVDTACQVDVSTTVDDDISKTVFQVRATPGVPIRLTKFATYHTSRGVPTDELIDRCQRTLQRAEEDGLDQLIADQVEHLDRFWAVADIEITGDDAAQQALRWNLFQLLQASACNHEHGIAAKAVTGGGYDGHYFWDTEVYVVPFLAYIDPEAARKMVRFRWRMLDAARERAREMSQSGALYPWRTINGEEASAYYAAGTAQYHINAAIVFALRRYLEASGDIDFLAKEGAEVLIETARLWADLGFFATNGSQTFHIHRVTGPDEYTTVVNDNAYTNLMARFNLRYAARTMRLLAEWNREAFDRLCRTTGLALDELDSWDAAADAMFIPYDDHLGIHPQDSTFLELEPWPWDDVPDDRYPLLLHYHPLVIYRHQVLKQADVVLAMFLRSENFSAEQKRRNFDYYDPITTGDSSLSACVQAIVAADVGYDDLALDYFNRALYLDLCDSHGNTAEGVHIASSGGVWAGIVHGFAGMRENGDHVSFAPRLPASWQRVVFHLRRHGSVIHVSLDPDGCDLTVEDGDGLMLLDAEREVLVEAGQTHRIDRDDRDRELPGAPIGVETEAPAAAETS